MLLLRCSAEESVWGLICKTSFMGSLLATFCVSRLLIWVIIKHGLVHSSSWTHLAHAPGDRRLILAIIEIKLLCNWHLCYELLKRWQMHWIIISLGNPTGSLIRGWSLFALLEGCPTRFWNVYLSITRAFEGWNWFWIRRLTVGVGRDEEQVNYDLSLQTWSTIYSHI